MRLLSRQDSRENSANVPCAERRGLLLRSSKRTSASTRPSVSVHRISRFTTLLSAQYRGRSNLAARRILAVLRNGPPDARDSRRGNARRNPKMAPSSISCRTPNARLAAVARLLQLLPSGLNGLAVAVAPARPSRARARAAIRAVRRWGRGRECRRDVEFPGWQGCRYSSRITAVTKSERWMG
jgi:hypothetical protein